jgi:hypothetical protein
MLMQAIYDLYSHFLALFPASTHGIISIVLAGLIIYGIIKVIYKDFIYLILLVVLLPVSVPILKNVWQVVLSFITFLLNKK